MTSLNHFIYIGFTALLLLTSTLSLASPLDRINQLKAEREQLELETQKIIEQTLIDRAKIKQLEQRIKLLYAQNKMLDQRILKEIERYEDTAHTPPGAEK